jgi:hypothetical protein
MSTEELNRLLGKYYNGDCTEEEERILRGYFLQDDVPEGYNAEKVIFGYYNSSGDIPEPSADFEARIMSGIDAVDTENESRKFRRYILPYLGAAAGLLILAGSWFFFVHRSETGDTFSDPQIAYAETINILLNVSSQLNHSSRSLEPVSQINEMASKSFRTINKKTLLVEKSLKNLDDLRKIKDSRDNLDNKIINK